MSQRYVRNTIRLWARQVFALPFYDSINRVIAPPDDYLWSTVEFDPSADQLISFCGDRLSSGLADFIFAGPPNTGDDALLEAAEISIERLMRFVDPTGALVLAYAHQPAEFTNGTADHNYRIFVGVEYRHYWTQPLNPPIPLPMP